jgi:hypothetical protein
VRRLVGAVALVAGAVLAVEGSRQPLYDQARVDSGYRSGYRMTLWGGESTNPDGAVELVSQPIRFGVPVIAAVVLLLVAAVLVPVSARLTARWWVAARVAAVAAAALLLGSVWTVGQFVAVAAREVDLIGGTIVTTVGAGTWLLAFACVAALVGAVLVQQRSPVAYQSPDEGGTDTPPTGAVIHPSVSTEESSPG